MAKKERWKLFLDDLRTPNDDSYLLATDVEEAKQLIAHYGMPHYISFDHDLGEDANGSPLESGYDFAKWLVSMELDGLLKFPEDFAFSVHSMNPVGAKNIHSYMKNYLLVRSRPFGGS